ncbi:hypothetical protein HYPDE_37063 [Hyphomicrobium denitrificans 1NES1]|uniref:Uncharacterized protein n=1 Tax=Hyphomicrobium denitrificans 1NES1 TaxID=670307 RepID=N0B689_9HYPH|nr:hypothetical protein HYPDE_37063 [Hyphomicrobium denitrificans 1NES1]
MLAPDLGRFVVADSQSAKKYMRLCAEWGQSARDSYQGCVARDKGGFVAIATAAQPSGTYFF